MASIYIINSIDIKTGENHLYVGSTEDWEARSKKHIAGFSKTYSGVYHRKLYTHLRENTNEPPVMIEVDMCPVEERWNREQEWYDKLKPELSCRRVKTSKTERRRQKQLYYIQNKEHINKRCIAYNHKNKENIKKQYKKYYNKNKDRLLQQRRERYKKN
jgi:predicted GIY-YIG superfamily endonuclease